MKKLFVSLIALCLLTTPVFAKIPNVGVDGYEFEQKTTDDREFKVVVFVHKNVFLLRAAALRNGLKDVNDVIAFSVKFDKLDICAIHVVDPVVLYMPEYMGHELAHCVWGKWHKND